MAERSSNGSGGSKGGLLNGGSSNELSEEFHHLLSAVSGKVLSGASNKVGGLTDKLTDIAENSGNPTTKALGTAGGKLAEGKSPMRAGLAAGAENVKDKVTGLFGKGDKGGKGGGKGGKKIKVTNIIESIDVGAPVDVVYNQWTQFQDFSNFMKKVEGVDQNDEQKLNFKAQVFWSHRTWEATIVEQVPDSRIIWRSKGPKGHVDGAVTFHELGPELTRVLVVLEYYPQGLFERTGNLWRAQGRRARLELKHFRRHVMTQTLLHPDDVQGWRGEIHDSKVVKSDEEARQEAEDSDADDQNDDGADEDTDAEDNAEDSAEDEDSDEDEADEDDDDEDADAEDSAEDEDAEDEADEDYDEDAEDYDDAEEGEADEEDEADEDTDEEDDEDDDELEDYDEDADEQEDEDTDEDERPRRSARNSKPRSRRPARAGRR
jgi:Polyketide cyclase / dehydrase and lipid transport